MAKEKPVKVSIEVSELTTTAQAMRGYMSAIVADTKLGRKTSVKTSCEELNKLVARFVYLATS